LSYKEHSHRNSGYGIRRVRRVQARRSDHTKAIDRWLKAPRAMGVDQELCAPNHFDLLTVDKQKQQDIKKVKD
jgi:hypothetical protein